MIATINLTNIQSHKDTTLELHPGVNVIIGASDSGKTAVLRGLRWLIRNRPSGDALRSRWGGDSEVSLVLDDQEVHRIRTNSKNLYRVGDSEHAAVGTEVPEAVAELLRVDEVNLQAQFDRPFLIGDTPGEVAKHFNKVAHLERIDSSIKAMNGWIREIDKDIAVKNQQVEEGEERLEDFADLPRFEADVEVLEGVQGQFLSLTSSYHKLKGLRADILNAEEDLKVKQDWVERAEAPILSLLALHDGLQQKTKDREVLQRLMNEVENCENDIAEGELETEALPLIAGLLQQGKELEGLRKQLDALERIISSVRRAWKAQQALEGKLGELEEEYVTNFPNVCPLCGAEQK